MSSMLLTSTALANVDGVEALRRARRTEVTDFQMKALSASSVEMKLVGDNSRVATAFKRFSELLSKEKDAQEQAAEI